MDNDIPENQQDRETAVSDIKHLDQSKKEKIRDCEKKSVNKILL